MQAISEETEPKPDAMLNSTKICRFCLSPAGVMSPIFEDGELNSLPLSSKIMAFISVQVYVNDGLPSLICHRCLYQVEKSYDFKTQCEASDAMLRKYLSAMQSSRPIKEPEIGENLPLPFDVYTLTQFQKSLHATISDSPFKRKRGRPRKEENMMFYSSPHQNHFCNGIINFPEDTEIKIVDGIESVVTVVDPRSEILSNSDDENRGENENLGDSDRNDAPNCNGDSTDSLELARAKAKKYMGIVFGMDENGLKTKKHLCKGCGKMFGHCSDLRKHVLVHTGERPFRCRLCFKSFSRSTNLNKHMKVHTGQKPYFCPECMKTFATKGDLQRHLIIHSGMKPFECQICHQCFSRKDKLTRHYRLHDNATVVEKPDFKCTSCSAVLNSEEDLKSHFESDHSHDNKHPEDEEDEEGRSVADEMPVIKEEVDLKEESSIEEGVTIKIEKEDSLPDCEVNPEVESMVINIDPFQMDSDLNDSIPNWGNDQKPESKPPDFVNGIGEEKPLSFYSKPDGIVKPAYQCRMCFKKFTEPAYLRSHMVTHSMIKPHKCPLCDKSFTRRRELLRHENVHTGYKPFKCNTCGKAFSRKDKLVRHEKIHNGMKKFPCAICPSLNFLKVPDLLHHHRSSHPNIEIPYVLPKNSKSCMRYQCETCFMCYRSLKSYQAHIDTHKDKISSQKFNSGLEITDDDNSDDENLTNNSLEQLNSNPAITVTSLSKLLSR